jgi:hypothetical protein
MNKFLKVNIESRGEVEEMEVVESELSIEKFCEELYSEMVKECIDSCIDEEEVKSMKEYLDEFGLCEFFVDCWEVSVSEEGGYRVYELK